MHVRIVNEIALKIPDWFPIAIQHLQQSPGDTNVGAEVLFALQGDYYPKTVDIDHDGLREAYDCHGNPMILLCDSLPKDILVLATGERVPVELPPYCGGKGVYVTALDYWTWLEDDAESLSINTTAATSQVAR